MIKNIFDYKKKLNKSTFMDSPFAYVLLCQNQSVFLSRSGASGEMQRKSPSSPRILLKEESMQEWLTLIAIVVSL